MELRQHLERAQDNAETFERMYQARDKECKHLAAEFRCQEDDRAFIIK
jgi:hypothetical protein